MGREGREGERGIKGGSGTRKGRGGGHTGTSFSPLCALVSSPY